MKQKINTQLFLDYMEKEGLSKTAFCKKCKISYVTLNKILNEQTNFKIIALFRLARVLGIHVHQMFIDVE